MNIEIGQVLAIGGPTSVVTAIFVILVNAYLSGRKDKREQQAADVATDSGIVDNAKKVLDIVRTEADRMAKRNIDLEVKNRDLEQLVNKQEDQIARDARTIGFLTEDITRMRDVRPSGNSA